MTNRYWHILEFTVDDAHEDLAGWLMLQQGASGCQIEPQANGRVRMRASFERDKLPEDKKESIMAVFDEYGLSKSIASLSLSNQLEEDWLAKWKEGFTPFSIGSRLAVCPLWLQNKDAEPISSEAHTIFIDPGLAFGTGYHATTRFCLLKLQDYIDSACRIVDIGTGSGILAMGAVLLNKNAYVLALETDPVAIENAQQNIKANGLNGLIHLGVGSTELIAEDAGFELVLSNLTCEDHLALLGEYRRISSCRAHLILSGILSDRINQLKLALKQQHFAIVQEEVGQVWSGLVVCKL